MSAARSSERRSVASSVAAAHSKAARNATSSTMRTGASPSSSPAAWPDASVDFQNTRRTPLRGPSSESSRCVTRVDRAFRSCSDSSTASPARTIFVGGGASAASAASAAPGSARARGCVSAHSVRRPRRTNSRWDTSRTGCGSTTVTLAVDRLEARTQVKRVASRATTTAWTVTTPASRGVTSNVSVAVALGLTVKPWAGRAQHRAPPSWMVALRTSRVI
mmetsp:Transcript_5936/g.18891  ORF Transcript_5936/g.18891 Transcript_5936/m.18891 type:complete len:220 (-) Transcript_5936:1005-1664(-)